MNDNHIDYELVRQWAKASDDELESDFEYLEPWDTRAICRELLAERERFNLLSQRCKALEAMPRNLESVLADDADQRATQQAEADAKVRAELERLHSWLQFNQRLPIDELAHEVIARILRGEPWDGAK